MEKGGELLKFYVELRRGLGELIRSLEKTSARLYR